MTTTPPPADGGPSFGEAVARAAAAYRALADLAETVEDEWQYVEDLVAAYLPAIEGLAGDAPSRPLGAEASAAVDEVIAEIALITDPHRAIDWLSTFPHVLGLALGVDVDAEGTGAVEDWSGLASGDDLAELGSGDQVEDSPFSRLLRRNDG